VIGGGSRRGGGSRDSGGSISRWSDNTSRGGSSLRRGLGLDAPFLGGEAAAAADQLVVAAEEAAAAETMAAALADGAAMPDTAVVPFAGALALDAPFLARGAAAAAE
jgi:hypothetical protein